MHTHVHVHNEIEDTPVKFMGTKPVKIMFT